MAHRLGAKVVQRAHLFPLLSNLRMSLVWQRTRLPRWTDWARLMFSSALPKQRPPLQIKSLRNPFAAIALSAATSPLPMGKENASKTGCSRFVSRTTDPLATMVLEEEVVVENLQPTAMIPLEDVVGNFGWFPYHLFGSLCGDNLSSSSGG
ncbi:hypothetical protein AMTR_s00150p00046650 [Amborella trichopoda]|uniref:Uncharacterized protein n=1 Tax=Amborella trichopoda TaxID=13333 RepID=W1PKZ8_AMBTC|nr:hypothetical protein AMTR_s00150p00046650 [Amborella trichopoda]